MPLLIFLVLCAFRPFRALVGVAFWLLVAVALWTCAQAGS
jgi:hypothetical protein